MKKALIIILALLVVLGGIIFYTKGVEKAGEELSDVLAIPTTPDSIVQTTPTNDASSAGQAAGTGSAAVSFLPSNTTFEWKCEAENDEKTQFVPSSSVALKATSKGSTQTFPIGDFSGYCSEVSGAGLQKNQLSGNLIYFAGGGTEFGVFNENEKIIVKSRELEEGDAETPGFTTAYKVLFSIDAR